MKISVIVPIYNSEKYLKKAIQSILNQTFIDFELILINDGSTDSSLTICQEFIKIDSRIVLISQRNEGVSQARNRGLEIAKGEYISFVDSDDVIEKNFLEKLYHHATKNDKKADVVFCNRIMSNGKTSWFLPFKQIMEFKDDTLKEYFYNILYGAFESFVTNKLYKKKLIDDSAIRFIDSSFMEDHIFNLQVIEESKLIIFIPDALYVYRSVFKGLTNKMDSRRCKSIINNYELQKTINNRYLTSEEKKNYECYFMKNVLTIILFHIDETRSFELSSFIEKYDLESQLEMCRICKNRKYSWCNDISHYINGKKFPLVKRIYVNKILYQLKVIKGLFKISFKYMQKEKYEGS